MIAQNSIVQNKWAVSPYCKLFLNMDGANDGTSFVDLSPSPKTITVNGNTCTKTAVKRFGTASAYFDGNGDYLTIPYSSDTTVPTGNFTLSFWFNNINSNNTDKSIISWVDSTVTNTAIYLKGNGYLAIGRFGENEVQTSTACIVDNMWHNVIVTYNGTTTKMYVDGVEKINTTTAVWLNTGNKPLYIGYAFYTSSRYYTGYIDDLVLINGDILKSVDIYPPRASLFNYAISEWGGQ